MKKMNIDLILSFSMPEGYETAFGTFDVETKTVFINADHLKEAHDYEKAFYLFHELRHGVQIGRRRRLFHKYLCRTAV